MAVLGGGRTAARKGSEVTRRPRRHGAARREGGKRRTIVRSLPLDLLLSSPPWSSVSPWPPCHFGASLSALRGAKDGEDEGIRNRYTVMRVGSHRSSRFGPRGAIPRSDCGPGEVHEQS